MTEKDEAEHHDARVASIRSSITYVRRGGPSKSTAGENQVSKYVRAALQNSWSAQADGQLLSDIQSVMEGGCIYLPGFLCDSSDFSLLASLTKDLEAHAAATEGQDGGMVNWSKHLKHENPDFSPTFRSIVARLDAHFDVEVYATRLNFYRDGKDYKPFHHDSHAYGSQGKKEDMTVGASFGTTRELSFLHEPSGQSFTFPQANGDVFAFDSDVNAKFQHGVPKVKGNPAKVGPRVSIIAWGRRRSLNERNSSSFRRDSASQQAREQEMAAAPAPRQAEAGGAGHQQRRYGGASGQVPRKRAGSADGPAQGQGPAEKADEAAEAVTAGAEDGGGLDVSDMASMVHSMIAQQQQAKDQQQDKKAAGGAASRRRGGRLQHSWAK